MSEGVTDKYISVILSQRPDLTRVDLLKLIEEKGKEAKVSSAYKTVWSIFMVAHDLGVKLEQVISEPSVKIQSLTPGLRNVTVIGRAIWIRTEEVLGAISGEKIKLCRVVLGDDTGWCYAILWRNLAEAVEMQAIAPGDVVRLRRTYCKEGRFGILEVHTGLSSAVEKVEGVEGLPDIDRFFIKISDVTTDLVVAHVEAILRAVFPVREFERSKERKGYVRRIILEGEGTEMQASLWDSSASEVSDKDAGKRIRLVGARIRVGLNGGVELSVNNSGGVILLERVRGSLPSTSIKDVKPGEAAIKIEAKVIKVFTIAKVSLRDLGERYYREFIIADETGNLDLMIWGPDENVAGDIQEGDVLMLAGVSVKVRGEQTYLQLGRGGTMSVIKDVDHPLRHLDVNVEIPTRLSEVKDGGRNLSVEGVVTSEVDIAEVPSRTSGGYKTKASFLMVDDSGSVSVVAWDADVQKVRDLGPNVAIKMKWCDARRDPFSGMIQLLISLKTQVEKI